MQLLLHNIASPEVKQGGLSCQLTGSDLISIFSLCFLLSFLWSDFVWFLKHVNQGLFKFTWLIGQDNIGLFLFCGGQVNFSASSEFVAVLLCFCFSPHLLLPPCLLTGLLLLFLLLSSHQTPSSQIPLFLLLTECLSPLPSFLCFPDDSFLSLLCPPLPEGPPLHCGNPWHPQAGFAHSNRASF